MKIDLQFSEKQKRAWDVLFDDKTTELFFGGGAGGGKSRLGCSWAILLCLKHKGIRGLIGRKRLKRLKETTLNTFFEVCRDWKLKRDVHYKYNAQDGIIKFYNGSEILLKDLNHNPSDPDYDELGSLEITFAFIDEGPQITSKCFSVVNSRIRYKLDENGLIPKCFITGNPTKKWLYSEFYKPKKEGKLEDYRGFIQALAYDNPFNSKYYIKQLKKIKDKNTRERLLNGNWEYDDDPSVLFTYEGVLDMFTNTAEKSNENIMSGDVARKGRDKMPLGFWTGLLLRKVYNLPYEVKKSTKKSAEYIKDKAGHHGVRFSNIVLDEDGIGGGVIDNIPNCIGFINNAPAFLSDSQKRKKKKGEYYLNYGNLKTQCWFKLAELVEDGLVEVAENAFDSDDDKQDFIEELCAIKQKDVDRDGKVYVEGKDKVKDAIGRSPDFGDMVMMRMLFLIKQRKKITVSNV